MSKFSSNSRSRLTASRGVARVLESLEGRLLLNGGILQEVRYSEIATVNVPHGVGDTNSQRSVSVDYNPTAGKGVVAWTESVSGANAIRYRLFNGSGNFTSDVVNVPSSFGEENLPKVSVRDDGSWALVSLSGDSTVSVRYRLYTPSDAFDATGTLNSWATTLDVDGWGTGSTGGYVIGHSAFGSDGSNFGIEVARISAAASLLSNVVVNTTTAGNQGKPAVATKPDGAFVVAFEAEGYDGSGTAAIYQAYDVNGNAVGGNVRVNSGTDGVQGSPSVRYFSDGGFVIAFDSESVQGDGNGFGIAYQLYDSSQKSVGGNTFVNTFTTGNQQQPDISVAGDNSFVIAWQDNSANVIRGKSFTADRLAVTQTDQTLATNSTLSQLPKVAAISPSRFAFGVGVTDNSGDARFGVKRNLLYIQGTDEADNLTLQQQPTGITVDGDGLSRDFGAANIEAIEFRGGRGGDTLSHVVATGFTGNLPVTIFGNEGVDSITGSDRDDAIFGGPGGDTINGLGGNDAILGEDGVDSINGGDGNDTITGGGGADTISGNNGNDLIRGGNGDDSLFGNDGNDRLFGDVGDDILRGEAGRDSFDGGTGSDSADRRGTETTVSIEVLA